jgi:ribosomal protein L39E
MSNFKLLVPMYMEALALSNDNNDCMDLRPQWQNYSQSILGNVLQPDSNRSLRLERGIHLHWSLPKALKHSFIGEGETKFPYAPNRWMIVRIRTDRGIDDMPSRMWIIKSDQNNAIKNNKPAPNWVVLKDNKLTFKNLGQAFEWVDTYDDMVSEPVLTGIGAADPYFASFYPSCKNVFGFHDDLNDIDSNCTLTYVVSGWYSDPAQDPLALPDFRGLPKTAAQIDKEQKLKWFKSQWKYGGEYPESCLLHSSITSIKWNDQLKGGVPDGEVQVYAGNTAIESLSAQITRSNNTEKSGVEELLNALQYQLLDDKENEPSLASIQKEIHKLGFSPKNRNSFWEITRAEATDKHLEDNQEKRPRFPEKKGLLKDLKELNKAQIDKNGREYEILSLQQEYYFLWYKEANKTVNNYQIPSFDYENSKKKYWIKLLRQKWKETCLQQRSTGLPIR